MRAHRRLVRIGATLVVALVLLLGVGFAYLTVLPGVGDAQARVEAILTAHHGVMGGLPVPARLGKAIVAVEDRHLYSSFEVDIAAGLARAAVAAFDSGGDPGGSTIPQQLAEALYGKGSGLFATLRELGLAVKLSLRYSKATILSMYLNAIYYGNGYWGDVAAARGYFGVSPGQLDWAQASMLAGLPQAPTAYDPLRHLALARERQRHVLDRLVAVGTLSSAQADAAYREPLRLRG